MKSTPRTSLLLAAALALAACGPAATPELPTAAPTAPPAPTEPPPAPTEPPAPAGPWWNSTVFYEIFVRSFKDSDGDGIGDFNGIAQQLDYLEQLGIRGLWLMPIHPSPSYHGYDVTDYYAVNPDYGTLDDFKNLLAEAHQRGIRIIIDLVLNHTSAQHPWFRQALEGQPEYKDWYIWSDTDPGFAGPWGAKAWHKASNGQYYYAIFWDQMPDLNYDNPAVREEVDKVTAFWLQDVGIDGFRLDAIRYLDEDGRVLQDSGTTHAYLKAWGAYYRSLNPQAFTVGEVWTSNTSVVKYLQGDELDSAFNFDFSLNADSSLRRALGDGNGAIVNFLLADMLKSYPRQNNANFLTNHDMNRAASLAVGRDPLGQGKAAAALLLTTPGIPFIYYGEEIGMTGVKPDERLRTPMQWMGEPKAGFTTGTPWEMINADYTTINVAAQAGDPTSLLEHYRRLIALRNTHPALSAGATRLVDSESRKIVSFLRVSGGEAILVIINIDDQPASDYALTLDKGPLSGAYTATSLLDAVAAAAPGVNAAGGFDAYTPLAEIPPYGVLVLELAPQ
jgi:glycosidase